MFTDSVLLTRLPLSVLARLAQVSRSLHAAIEQNMDSVLVGEFDSSILQSYQEYAYCCSKFKFLNVLQCAITNPDRIAKSADELVVSVPCDDFRARVYSGRYLDWNKQSRTYKLQLLALNCIPAIQRVKWGVDIGGNDLVAVTNLTPIMQVQTLMYSIDKTPWGPYIRSYGRYLQQSFDEWGCQECKGCSVAMNLVLIHNRLDLVQWMDRQKIIPFGGDPSSHPFKWGDRFTKAMEWYVFHGTCRPNWVIKCLAGVAGRAGNYSVVRKIYDTYQVVDKYSLVYCLTTQPLSATEWVLEKKLLSWNDIFGGWKCYQRPDILQFVYQYFGDQASTIVLKNYMKKAACCGTAETITWMRSIGCELDVYYINIILIRRDLSVLRCLTDEDLRSSDKYLRSVGYCLMEKFDRYFGRCNSYEYEHKIIYGWDSYFTIVKYLASRGYWPLREYLSYRWWRGEKSDRQWIEENYWFITYSLSAVRSRISKILSSVLSH